MSGITVYPAVFHPRPKCVSPARGKSAIVPLLDLLPKAAAILSSRYLKSFSSLRSNIWMGVYPCTSMPCRLFRSSSLYNRASLGSAGWSARARTGRSKTIVHAIFIFISSILLSIYGYRDAASPPSTNFVILPCNLDAINLRFSSQSRLTEAAQVSAVLRCLAASCRYGRITFRLLSAHRFGLRSGFAPRSANKFTLKAPCCSDLLGLSTLGNSWKQ